jgi:hypothetical protein
MSNYHILVFVHFKFSRRAVTLTVLAVVCCSFVQDTFWVDVNEPHLRSKSGEEAWEPTEEFCLSRVPRIPPRRSLVVYRISSVQWTNVTLLPCHSQAVVWLHAVTRLPARWAAVRCSQAPRWGQTKEMYYYYSYPGSAIQGCCPWCGSSTRQRALP